MFLSRVTQRVGTLRLIAWASASLILSACGGGGGSGGGGGGTPNPPQPSISIGGTVSGLASGASVVLQNNGQNPTTVNANGSFAFSTLLAANAAYAVTVSTQPASPQQTCVVTNGSGTAAANVTNVAVNCTTNAFQVNVAVTGLQGTGLVVRNGTDSLNVTGNGTFPFPTLVASGGSYNVSVQTNPAGPSQTCSVSGSASGTMVSAPVTVNIVCSTSSFPVSATVTGLAGSGLVLRNNGGNDLAVTANGTVAFTSPVASGATYNVTVQTAPVSPTQTCVVTGGNGTITNAPVSAAVTCTTVTRTVGGTVTGLVGTGLQLTNNAGNALPISADGAFTFTTPIASGVNYSVAVSTQPSVPTQVCTVANGTGTIVGSNITDVAVTCVTSKFTIGGTISGLAPGGTVVLQNAGNNLTVTANGSFTFGDSVSSGGAYAVTALANATRVCTLTSATGTVVAANITSVVVRCRTKYAYFTEELGGRAVSSYTIGADGAFTLASTQPVQTNTDIPATVGATGVAVTPSGSHVIVAADADNQTVVQDGELQVFSVNANNGQLTWVSKTRMGLPNYENVFCGTTLISGDLSCGIGVNSAPETVVIHPSGRFVYVMDGVARGACNNSSAPCTSPKGGNRIIVRYTFDAATGTLTFQDRHYVEGFITMAMDPRGRFLWGTSFLDRQIYAFRIDQSTGALTFSGGTFIGTQNGEQFFGTEPSGTYAYVSHFTDETIDAYTIDPTTGRLINIPNTNGVCCNKATGVQVYSLAVSADSRTLYGARADGTVVAYALGTDGRIGAQIAGSPYAPATPLSGGAFRALLGIDSPGQFLYLQGAADPGTRVFSINQTNGVLTEATVSPTSLSPGGNGTTALSVQ